MGSTCQQMHCVISSVDLLAPSVEGLTVSMILFLGAVLQFLHPSLSYTLFTRTDEVSNTLFSVSASSAKLHLQQRLNFLSQDSSLTTPTGLCYRGETTVTITKGTEDTPPPSPSYISILTNPPAKMIEQMEFNLSQYYETLHTTRLGQVVLYTPVIASTQSVFTGNIKFATTASTSGVICIAGQQTQGKGAPFCIHYLVIRNWC